MIEKAQKVADKSCRHPGNLPWEQAFFAAIIAALIIVTYQLADDLMSRGWAEVVTIAIVAGVTFLDARQRWRRHSEIFYAELKRLRDRETGET